MSNKFLTVIYDMSRPGMQQKAHLLLLEADWTASGWSHAFADRDEARKELYRLQESIAAAPQVVADERAGGIKELLENSHLQYILKKADEARDANDMGRRARATFEELCEFIFDYRSVAAPVQVPMSVQSAFEKATSGCVFGDASRLDAAQDWFKQGYIAAAPVQVQEPFMYGIMGPDGKAHLDENCVGPDPESLYAELNGLNDDPAAGYSIVKLFTAPVQPVAVPDGKYGRLTGDNVAQPVQMKGKEK